LLDNAEWSEGVAASVRVAARWAEEHAFAALMLLVCDQLKLNAAQLSQLYSLTFTTVIDERLRVRSHQRPPSSHPNARHDGVAHRDLPALHSLQASSRCMVRV
jgi:hypothetical protein